MLPRSSTSAALLAACVGACLATGCFVLPPPVEVSVPAGRVRGQTRQEAERVAAILERVRPEVEALVPDLRPGRVELWIQDLRGIPSYEVSMHAQGATVRTSFFRDRRRGYVFSGEAEEAVVVHELVHMMIGPGWNALPQMLEEGLCQLVEERVTGADSRHTAAIVARGFAGDLDVVVRSEPDLGDEVRGLLRGSVQVDVTLGRGLGLACELSAEEMYELEAEDVALSQDADFLTIYYALALLLVSDIEARVGLEGLHALSVRAAEEGRSGVPLAPALAAAGLASEPDPWTALGLRHSGPRMLRELALHAIRHVPSAFAGTRPRAPRGPVAAWLRANRVRMVDVATGRELPLADDPELVRLIEKRFGSPTSPALPSGPGDPGRP